MRTTREKLKILLNFYASAIGAAITINSVTAKAVWWKPAAFGFVLGSIVLAAIVYSVRPNEFLGPKKR